MATVTIEDPAVVRAELRRIANEIRELLRPTRAATSPDVISGGRLATSLDELLDISATTIRGLADQIDAVAAGLIVETEG